MHPSSSRPRRHTDSLDGLSVCETKRKKPEAPTIFCGVKPYTWLANPSFPPSFHANFVLIIIRELSAMGPPFLRKVSRQVRMQYRTGVCGAAVANECNDCCSSFVKERTRGTSG